MDDRQIEMHWYCGIPSCHHDNRGRDLSCANCGKPRENEEYLMPGDTRAAPTVTDPALLKKAKAGANWHCRYCRSSQRRLDGACARCGAPAAEGTEESAPARQETAPPVEAVEVENPYAQAARRRQIHKYGLIGSCLMLVCWLCWWLFIPHEQRVKVAAVHWTHTVEIERYKVVTDSGWYAASDAFDVHYDGERIHHYDHRAVGSHVEYYTVQVACGQTCTPIPRSCSERCTSNRNGFATCSTSCTGGGQSCSTKYCNDRRHREVVDYQDFPIYQRWYSWHVWRWSHQRDVVLSGADTATRWPNPKEERLHEDLAGGEDEREGNCRREYKVRYARGDEFWETSLYSEIEFRKRLPGSSWRINVNRLGIVSNEQKD